jgi:hypothetical protein
MKRRSLKAKAAPATPISTPSAEISPDSPTPAPAAPTPAPRRQPAAAKTSAALPRTPLHTTDRQTQPAPSAPAPAASAGDRSAPLYYGNGSKKEQEEEAPPMKSTSPAAQPAPSFVTASPARPNPAPGRATSVSDYRANIERQTREQKSTGSLLGIIVYSLIAFCVLGALLAGYGTYVLSKQIHQESVTMTDLDSRYSAQNQALTAQIKANNDTLTQELTQAQAQLNRQQELILRQQEAITKLMATNDALASALRTERQSRAGETASLRARIHVLENQAHL